MKKTYPDSRIIAPTAGQGWIWRLKPMYESPIFVRQKTESIVRKYREKIDDYIYESVVKVGVDVDKEELIRALRYDRDQYDRGYSDGYSRGYAVGEAAAFQALFDEAKKRMEEG